VTFSRDGNLFIMALATGSLQQLTDVAPKRRDPRETDSQKYVKAEEQKLIDYTKEQVAKKKEAEEKRKKGALPQFETQDGQAATDLMLAPDEDHVFIMVGERAGGAKSADVPNYVTESSYPENIPARPLVGDAQASRRLGMLNLKTGKAAWADSAFAGTRKAAVPTAGGTAKEVPRDVNWSMPVFSPDGKRAVAVVSSADFKDRWFVTLDADTGQARVVDQLHDDAWILGGGASVGCRPAPDRNLAEREAGCTSTPSTSARPARSRNSSPPAASRCRRSRWRPTRSGSISLRASGILASGSSTRWRSTAGRAPRLHR
jgi:hypothetical protein